MLAKDKATGKEQKIRIEASSGIGDKEIDRMVKEAEAHAGEDKRRREEIETRNRLDAMVYDVEKNAKEWSDRLEASMKTRLDEAVDGAKKALRAGDAEGIKKAVRGAARPPTARRAGPSTSRRSPPASRGAEAPAGGAPPEGPKKPEDVVEADYEIMDDQEKK